MATLDKTSQTMNNRGMKKTKPLKSVAAVVRAFGGRKAMAEFCGVRVTAVYNWMDAEDFPSGWHYRLHVEAERRGYHIDPLVFMGKREGRPGKERAA